MTCQGPFMTGPHGDKTCKYPARYEVVTNYHRVVVCGYHKRTWLPRVVFPLTATVK